jgi:hypothetical protein
VSIARDFHTDVYAAVAALIPSRFATGQVTKEDQTILQASTARRAAIVREVEGEATELEIPATAGQGRYTVAVDVYEPKANGSNGTFQTEIATSVDLVAGALDHSQLAASGRERLRTQRIPIRTSTLSECDATGYGRIRVVVSATIYQ